MAKERATLGAAAGDGADQAKEGQGATLKQRLKSRLQARQVLDNGSVSFAAGAALLAKASLTPNIDSKLKLLASAARRLESPALQALGKRALAPWLAPDRVDVWRERKIGWSRYHGEIANIAKDRALSTSLLLKEPGENGEKGVLYCSFEYNWMKLVANHDARKFLSKYFLVGASSWSPSDYAVFANLAGLSGDPVFIGISNPADLAQYRLFEPHIYPLPIMACDWVDPQGFSPKPHQDRSIDLLMVSHTAYWKRHGLLFDALRHMRRDLNVVLIGRLGGRTVQEVMKEARAFGVKQDLTFLSHLEIDEVAQYQCDAKVTVALSKREGSCVSVTEALFADSPVAVMRDAHIGAKAYINPQTGRLLDRGSMPKVLSEMVESSGEYRPRAWALHNISAQLSSRKLNDILKQYSAHAGLPWTRDIAPMCWRYVPRYLHPADAGRFAAGVQRLQDEFGIQLEDFVSERAAHARNQGKAA